MLDKRKQKAVNKEEDKNVNIDLILAGSRAASACKKLPVRLPRSQGLSLCASRHAECRGPAELAARANSNTEVASTQQPGDSLSAPRR